jgi:hypothetical protein
MHRTQPPGQVAALWICSAAVKWMEFKMRMGGDESWGSCFDGPSGGPQK